MTVRQAAWKHTREPFTLGCEHGSSSPRKIGILGILDHPISAAIALVLSAWASFTFLRSSITGAPPLYSSGWFAHALHFVAGSFSGHLPYL